MNAGTVYAPALAWLAATFQLSLDCSVGFLAIADRAVAELGGDRPALLPGEIAPVVGDDDRGTAFIGLDGEAGLRPADDLVADDLLGTFNDCLTGLLRSLRGLPGRNVRVARLDADTADGGHFGIRSEVALAVGKVLCRALRVGPRRFDVIESDRRCLSAFRSGLRSDE